VSRLAELDVEDRDGVRVARIEGELDLSNVVDVGEALVASVDADAIGLVLDMTGLRHIDSAGVRMLFDLRRRLVQRRQALALAVPERARIRDVLDLAAVGETVPLFGDVAAAVAAARGA
jgi:anti-sigma B factor antagonist